MSNITPPKLFTQSKKSSHSNTPSNTTVVNTTPPSYGSKEALVKQPAYFIPGNNFGNVASPSRRSQKREVGYPGLRIFGGHVTEEFITDLQGYQGIQVYEEMRKNDPVVGAMLLVAEQLIHNAAVRILPSKSNPDAQESLMAADLVYTALFDMGNTWTDTLSEMLTFLAYGFAVCAVWHRQRNGYNRDKWKSSRYHDGKWAWAGISLRAQTTLESWETDKRGRAIGMWQQGPPTYERVLVPFTHAAHFRTRTERDDPSGMSILRNCWRCFSDDTEILTDNGWVNVKNINTEMLVATLDPTTNILEYRKPTEVQKYPYTGKMFHQGGRFIDFCVTPEHELYMRKASKAFYEHLPAKEVAKVRHIAYKRGAIWVGKEEQTFTLPEVQLRTKTLPALELNMDAWLRLLGIYIAEGSIDRSDPRKVYPTITQVTYKDEMLSWIRAAGFTPRVSGKTIRIYDQRLGYFLLQLGKSKDKHVPKQFKGLSKRQLMILLDALMLGDGYYMGVSRTPAYQTISKQLADDVSEIMLKVGYAPTTKLYNNPGRFGKNPVYIIAGTKPRKDGNRVNLIKDQREWVDYNGHVYNLTVPPHHLVYARRNGKPCWTHQSWTIKKYLEEVEAVGIERDLTGLSVLHVPEGLDIWNPNDSQASATLERAENIVRLARVDKFGGVVLPFGWDLKLMTTPGQRAHNSDTVINRWDQRIAVTLLADMLLIGHERVGSFALVQSKVRLFSSALESYAARISGVFNGELIPRMLQLNGIQQEYWPTMEFGPVETPALLDMAEYIKALSDVGVNIDESIGLYLRQIANLPVPKKGDKAVVEGGTEPTEPKTEPKTEHVVPPKSTKRAVRTDKGVIIDNDPMLQYSLGVEK